MRRDATRHRRDDDDNDGGGDGTTLRRRVHRTLIPINLRVFFFFPHSLRSRFLFSLLFFYFFFPLDPPPPAHQFLATRRHRSLYNIMP